MESMVGLFPFFNEVVLWHQGCVWYKLQEPCQEWYDKLAAYLLVHV